MPLPRPQPRKASRSDTTRRGFGAISKTDTGRYRVRYTGPDGVRRGAGRTFERRLDAEAWLVAEDRKISREFEEWEPPPKRKPKKVSTGFEEYAKKVLGRRQVRPATAALYDKLLRLEVLPSFGHMAVDAITRDDIEHWYRGMADRPTQRANAYGLLKSILKDAVVDEVIEKSPAVIKGGSQKRRAREIEVLTVTQLNTYLAAIPENRRMLLLITAWCGLRSGEARGLRVRDLDLDKGLIHVRQAVVRLKGNAILGPPKTRAGVRTIAIPPHLLKTLSDWAKDQPDRAQDALLFPARDGFSPLHPSVLRDAHYLGRAAIRMPHMTIHDLRHTSATLAAQQGATLAELQARIGHSTPNMAMRYQHVAAQRDAQLAARMSSFATGEDWTQATRHETEKPDDDAHEAADNDPDREATDTK